MKWGRAILAVLTVIGLMWGTYATLAAWRKSAAKERRARIHDEGLPPLNPQKLHLIPRAEGAMTASFR